MFPQHNEKSLSLKTMEDGQVHLHSVRSFFPGYFWIWIRLSFYWEFRFYSIISDVSLFYMCLSFMWQNSVNARDAKIPYPWLVFNEKIKVNSVFLRDSTAVSDSVALLFGGNIVKGETVRRNFPKNNPQFWKNSILFWTKIFLKLKSSSNKKDFSFNWFHFHLILSVLTGWTSENVRRILGIFHETWYGGNILEPKEGTGGFYTAQSKQSSLQWCSINPNFNWKFINVDVVTDLWRFHFTNLIRYETPHAYGIIILSSVTLVMVCNFLAACKSQDGHTCLSGPSVCREASCFRGQMWWSVCVLPPESKAYNY